MEIELSTNTISRSAFLTDLNVVKRAYLRRAAALEKSEKIKEAASDF